jgi:hypothetical protein
VKLADLLPGEVLLAPEASTVVADVVGREEHRGGEAEPLENREGMGVEVTVAIVEGQHHIFDRGIGGLRDCVIGSRLNNPYGVR